MDDSSGGSGSEQQKRRSRVISFCCKCDPRANEHDADCLRLIAADIEVLQKRFASQESETRKQSSENYRVLMMDMEED